MQLSYSIGTDQEIDQIHEMTVKILSEVGATFHSDEAVELFKKSGWPDSIYQPGHVG